MFKLKKNFFIKLIISIFIIIYVFNTLVPSYSYGWSLGGILFKPIAVLGASVLISISAGISLILGGIDAYKTILDENENWANCLASPEHIFAGSYPILDANIFDATVNTDFANGVMNGVQGGAGVELISNLKKAVSGIYYMLVAICGVVLLCLLIYTGIRIVLSSNSPQEQGKWKMYLMDWVKAVCLLLFAHVIMITVFYVIDIIKSAFLQSLGNETIAASCSNLLTWESWTFGEQFVALIMFGYVIYLTIVFIIAYFKRLVWTVLLIVIAPIITVVFPLTSKVYNGKEVFGRWLKEFVINAAIPVYHIIMYTVLLQIPLSAVAGDGSLKFEDPFTVMYSLIALTMIRPAEKFLRKLFGMDQGMVAGQASFESGKKTLDTGAKIAKDIAQGITMVGAAVATGGASLVATGGTGAKKGTDATGSLGNRLETEEMLGEETLSGQGVHELSDETESTPEVNDGVDLGENNATIMGLLTDIRDNTAMLNNNQNVSTDNDDVPQEEHGVKMTDLGDTLSSDEPKGIKEKLKQKIGRAKEIAGTPQFQNGIVSLRNALHEMTDTMYMPGDASGDWRHDAIGQLPEYNKEKMEIQSNAFVNNKYNQQWVMEKHQLMDKYRNMYRYSDGTPNEERAKQAAKEEAKSLLQKMTPYLGYGMNNLQAMDTLRGYQKDNGLSVEEAIKSYPSYAQDKREFMESAREYIINHNENIQIGTDKNNEPVYIEGKKLNDSNAQFSAKEMEAIDSYIQKRVDSATIYKHGGNSSEISLELAGLEKRLKDHNIKTKKGEVNQDFVTNLYDIVQKAVKENKGSRVSLPEANERKEVKNLENFLNTEIQRYTKK